MLKKNLNLIFESSYGGYYKMPIYPDFSFSQVYSEEQLERKTLHNPERLISDGFTSILNPGNFSFTIPLIDGAVMEELLSILLGLSNKHIFYVESEEKTIKLHNVVFSNIVFNTQRTALMTLSLTGQYSNSTQVLSLPTGDSLGTIYTYIEGINIEMGGLEIPYINNFNIEVRNTIEWLDNKTMHDVGPTYSINNYCSERIISGNIIQNKDIDNPTFNDNVDLLVQIKANNIIFLEFEFPKIIVTTRTQVDDIIKKGMDFRVTNNEANLIKYKGENSL